MLLEQDLAVLEEGVREARKTFANTHRVDPEWIAAVPASLVAWMVAIVIAYVVSAEFAKRWLFEQLGF